MVSSFQEKSLLKIRTRERETDWQRKRNRERKRKALSKNLDFKTEILFLIQFGHLKITLTEVHFSSCVFALKHFYFLIVCMQYKFSINGVLDKLFI